MEIEKDNYASNCPQTEDKALLAILKPEALF